MKIVPVNRLLLQPTVQLKWIEQHDEIEFEISEEDQLRFKDVWQAFKTSQATLPEFLNDPIYFEFNLHEDDTLISLLTGADYISQKYPEFQLSFLKPNLVWSV
jgi:hypothetical protein